MHYYSSEIALLFGQSNAKKNVFVIKSPFPENKSLQAIRKET